ncbi:MAG: hypothetical protein ACFFG0_02425 [Candidatus Thorarchaeota archaeon]
MIDYKSIIEQHKGKRDYLKNNLSDLKKNKEISIKLLKAIEEAQIYLQDKAKNTQSQIKFHMVDIVQLALDSVFPDEFVFDLEFELKKGKTDARLIFKVDGEEISPVDADGGGAVDIAAMALRIALWSLGKTRPTILLDEPFHFLDNTLQENGAELLKNLSKELGIQFIVVTHRAEISAVADKAFKTVQRKSGDYRKSIIEEL